MHILKLIPFVLYFIISGIQLEAAALKAIIIGDTFSDLSKQTTLDLQKIELEINLIATELRIPAAITILKNHQVNKVDVNRALLNLKVEPDDIVFFYYTGHGFRTAHQTSHWPNLYFTQTQTSLPFDEVISAIARKKPHFAFVVADCCNSPMVSAHNRKEGKRFFFPYHEKGQISCDVRKLFMETRGLLALSSASPGEDAWSSPRGGLFTIALLDSLNPNQPVSWQQLLQSVHSKMTGIQTPQHQFYKG